MDVQVGHPRTVLVQGHAVSCHARHDPRTPPRGKCDDSLTPGTGRRREQLAFAAGQAARRVSSVISGSAPTRTGGPQKPTPLVTYSWVPSTSASPETTGCCNRTR